MMLLFWTPNRKPEKTGNTYACGQMYLMWGASDPGKGFGPSMPGGEVTPLDTVLQSH